MKNFRRDYTPLVEAELDLHGCTSEEARTEVKEFLQEADENKWNRVRIVVGKGLHSKYGKAVLPDTVKAYLVEHGHNYTYAKLADGGEGALEVAL